MTKAMPNRHILATGLVCMTALSAAPTQAAPTHHHPVVGDRAGHGINLRRECARYASQGIDAQECVRQAAIARNATAKYRDFKAALADGFAPTGPCEQTAAGAMGQHWARLDRMAIDGVDPRTPEILLYLPTASGPELVGVESEESASVGGLPYYGSAPPDQSKVTPAPVMFGGRRFTARCRDTSRSSPGTTTCMCGCGNATPRVCLPNTTPA